jgi:hypothetical protein
MSEGFGKDLGDACRVRGYGRELHGIGFRKDTAMKALLSGEGMLRSSAMTMVRHGHGDQAVHMEGDGEPLRAREVPGAQWAIMGSWCMRRVSDTPGGWLIARFVDEYEWLSGTHIIESVD